jgi:hypothetical protein
MCYEPILKNIFVVVMVGRVVTDPSLSLSSPYEVVPQVLILVNEAKKHATVAKVVYLLYISIYDFPLLLTTLLLLRVTLKI